MDFGGQLIRLAKARQFRPLANWGILIALFALALGARVAFARELDPVPFAPFFLSVLAAALVCGWRKAMVLLATSAVAGWLFFAAKPVSLSLSPPFDVRVAAFLIGSSCAVALIEGLVQAMQRLEAAARLNRELFQELQHRVANNFQAVSATLQRAQREIADVTAVEAIGRAIKRTNSLAQLHRRLYDPESYDRGLAHILSEVLSETFRDSAVTVNLAVEDEALTVSQMTSIVLLVNEAAINAAKHVFQLGLGRSFAVSLARENDKRILSIHDDGPGFGPKSEDMGTSRYGLLVMRGFAAQLGGALEIANGPGAVIRVAF